MKYVCAGRVIVICLFQFLQYLYDPNCNGLCNMGMHLRLLPLFTDTCNNACCHCLLIHAFTFAATVYWYIHLRFCHCILVYTFTFLPLYTGLYIYVSATVYWYIHIRFCHCLLVYTFTFAATVYWYIHLRFNSAIEKR